MMRALVALAALIVATPTFADTPDKGDLGIGAVLQSGAVGTSSVGMMPGLNASYFITREVSLGLDLGLNTTSGATTFDIALDGKYYFMRDKQISPFVKGGIGIATASIQGNTSTHVLFEAGGGLEWFVNKNFGIRIAEVAQLMTNDTTFGFATKLGLTLYI